MQIWKRLQIKKGGGFVNVINFALDIYIGAEYLYGAEHLFAKQQVCL